MKIRRFGILIFSALILTISGCMNRNEITVNEIWEEPDGAYTIPLNISEWSVEKEPEGEFHFWNQTNEKFSFSISKWEKLQFPEEFDYEGYYMGYVEDIRMEFPEVEGTGLEIIELEDTKLVQMGVRYEVSETLSQVTTSMISIPNSEDSLCFVAIYPAENSKGFEEMYKKIVTGIRFDLEKE